MFSNQQHQIVGEMIDMDTGEIVLVLPEKKNVNKKFISSVNKSLKQKLVDLPKKKYENLMNITLKTHKLLGCRGVTRSDFKYHKGRFYLFDGTREKIPSVGYNAYAKSHQYNDPFPYIDDLSNAYTSGN